MSRNGDVCTGFNVSMLELKVRQWKTGEGLGCSEMNNYCIL